MIKLLKKITDTKFNLIEQILKEKHQNIRKLQIDSLPETVEAVISGIKH